MTARGPAPRARVTVIGTALIDEIHGGAGPGRYLGGAGFNLVIALAQHGTPAALAANLGADAEGLALRAALDRFGVTMITQPDLPATRRAATQLSDGEPRYRFGERTRRHVSLTPELISAVHRCAAVVVNSFPFESTEQVRDLTAILERTPALRIIDPNPRPDLMDDPGTFARNLRLLLASADIVKVSRADLATLHQGSGQLLDGAVQAVFLTKGPDGADIVTAQQVTYSVPATSGPPPADTVGAGDASLAGLIAALLRAQDAGAAHAERSGAWRRSALPSTDWPALLEVAMRSAAACCREPGGPAHALLPDQEGRAANRL